MTGEPSPRVTLWAMTTSWEQVPACVQPIALRIFCPAVDERSAAKALVIRVGLVILLSKQRSFRPSHENPGTRPIVFAASATQGA